MKIFSRELVANFNQTFQGVQRQGVHGESLFVAGGGVNKRGCSKAGRMW